ncbi:hypothetical protein V6N11_032978 [Hibiscus sabdariffa]|uniref:Uncharacterized protein n=1 Tax=Hibiscus sabdariffa TaxID=183260 RepID=A0ABR1Z6P3_9ROSI
MESKGKGSSSSTVWSVGNESRNDGGDERGELPGKVADKEDEMAKGKAFQLMSQGGGGPWAVANGHASAKLLLLLRCLLPRLHRVDQYVWVS